MSKAPQSNPNNNKAKPNPSKGDKNSLTPPNWKNSLFFVLMLSMIILAFTIPSKQVSSNEISLDQFKQYWEAGLVITDNQAKQPLIITTTQNSPEMTISGFISDNLPTINTNEKNDFNIMVHLNSEGQILQKLLKSNYQTVTSTALAPRGETLNFKQLKKLIATKQINLSNPEEHDLVLKINGNNDFAFLEGRYYSIQPTPQVTVEEESTGFLSQFKPKSQTAKPPYSFITKFNGFLNGEQVQNLVGTAAKAQTKSNVGRDILISLLPFLVIGLIIFFIFKQQMSSMSGKGGPMSMGKSKAKLMTKSDNPITFEDVAGVEESKEELSEIVEFLADPKGFSKLGGKIPKGVLMVGPPGTGKTLLAKAVAGEAGVPFFSLSGSDFMEMFVGIGASRVRDMFEQGRKNAPCIIFIDEIDAIGRARGQGIGGGHDEREQTLNQMLVEMDGFDGDSGVIIIAATNRPDVLDPALLRPGRFDRQVEIPLPDVDGRHEILKVHVKKAKIKKGIDLRVIARGTPGFSGAELANLINEAALLAVRRKKSSIELDDLEEARDKVRWGKERRSLALSEKEKENTAYHEAGHTILNIICKETDPLHKVTIIPRGPALGAMMSLPNEDKYTQRKGELLDRLIVLMGGRVAEEITFGNVTNGASGDIQMATNIAKSMVCKWGMSDKLGMIEYGTADGDAFHAKGKSYSENTAQLIDEEVKSLVNNAYKQAKDLLIKNQDKLELIAQALIKHETLDAAHIEELMEHGEIQTPVKAYVATKKTTAKRAKKKPATKKAQKKPKDPKTPAEEPVIAEDKEKKDTKSPASTKPAPAPPAKEAKLSKATSTESGAKKTPDLFDAPDSDSK